jgi:CHAT domain-containing protein
VARAQALEADAQRLGVPDLIAVSLLRRGDVLLSEGRPREAIGPLEQARAALRMTRKDDLGVRALAMLADAYGALGEWRTLDRVCQQGIDLVDAFRSKVTAPYLQSAYLRSRIGLYTWGVRAAHELGQPQRMLDRADRSKSRFVMRYLTGGTDAPDAGRVEAEFRSVCAQVDAAERDGRVTEPLLQKRRALWDLLVIERLRAGGQTAVDLGPGTIQDLLAEDEAVIYHYWLSRHELLIATIDRQRIDAEVRTLSPAERRNLEAFTTAVRTYAQSGPSSIFDQAVEFSTLLLPSGPQGAGILRHKRRLLVSPHRLLHAIPFHALHWDGRHLLHRFALTYVPNLATLTVTYRPPHQAPMVAVGVAHYQLGQPPLPRAEEEAEAVRDLYADNGFQAVALIGPDGTERKLEELERNGTLGRCGTLHLATHGVSVSGDTPMESNLILRDSVLDGLDISGWNLGAEVVVLSACCSGQRAIAGRGMQELPGDELLGLQAAFFAAGARRILGSLWPVDSAAAQQITTDFHRRLVEGTSPEVALQRATLDYLDGAGLLKRRAYYWAPFFIAAIGRRQPAEGRLRG